MLISWHSEPLGKRLCAWKSPALTMFLALFVYCPQWQLNISVDVLNIYKALLSVVLLLYVMCPFQYLKDIFPMSPDSILCLLYRISQCKVVRAEENR